MDLVCLDENGVVFARFHLNNWSLIKWGSLELMGPSASRGCVMEDTGVTGMAIVQFKMAFRVKGFAA